MIQQLKNILEGELWIDENFKNKIDKLSAKEALTAPMPQIFSVAELVFHILAWRKQLMKKLCDKKKDTSMEIPDYWVSNDELRKIGWNKLKKNFYESQYELISILENKDDTFLKVKYSGGFTYEYLIEGLIHHDIYHLGQMGVTIKLLNKGK